MARLIIAALLIVVPAILAAPVDNQARAYPVQGISQLSQAAGAAAEQYGNVQHGAETHDKKNFGLNFSSDKGSSNNYSNTQAQAAAAGANQQALHVPGYGGYNPYPYYPGYGYGVGAGAGVGHLGVPNYPTLPNYPYGYGGAGAVTGAGAVQPRIPY